MISSRPASPGSRVLVIGGAGYIGAHTAKALADSGWTPVVYDDLSGGFRESLLWGEFVSGDVTDRRALAEAMTAHRVSAVIHLAGLIHAEDSARRPDLFYHQNLTGLAAVLDAMRDAGVPRLIFSSTAAVYASAADGTILAESALTAPSSPYGDTKLAGERMIAAYCRAFGLEAVALRYFNAAGADPSGLIGEGHWPETHLVPLAIAAALGHTGPLRVFGTDFDTPDGSCVRDYVHVCDLAAGHVASLAAEMSPGEFTAMNLGGGVGVSVLEVIAEVEAALGRPVPWTRAPRRVGDPARLVADASLAAEVLGWKPVRSGLPEIVASAAAWALDPRYGGPPAAGRDHAAVPAFSADQV